MSWHRYERFPEYVCVAERKEKIQKTAQKLAKKTDLEPIIIQGRSITKTFWGNAWCKNIEAYKDYAYRLDRGRSYVRHGAVIDLKIKQGEVHALVCGSQTYTVKICITPASNTIWQVLIKECSGKINSLVELLQGKLSEHIMKIIVQPEKGLFPKNDEIDFDCSCPDRATVCKHVSAVLYGIGARFDNDPTQLFTLRGVNQNELIMNAVQEVPLNAQYAPSTTITDDDLSALFGIEVAQEIKPTKVKPKIVKSKKKTVKVVAAKAVAQTVKKKKTVKRKKATGRLLGK